MPTLPQRPRFCRRHLSYPMPILSADSSVHILSPLTALPLEPTALHHPPLLPPLPILISLERGGSSFLAHHGAIFFGASFFGPSLWTRHFLQRVSSQPSPTSTLTAPSIFIAHLYAVAAAFTSSNPTAHLERLYTFSTTSATAPTLNCAKGAIPTAFYRSSSITSPYLFSTVARRSRAVRTRRLLVMLVYHLLILYT